MNDNKQSAPKNAPDRLDLPKGIQVSFVRWQRIMQVPGRQADDSLSAQQTPNGRSWEIEYVPAMRHFKITYTEHTKPPEVGFVHEVHAVMWKPVAL